MPILRTRLLPWANRRSYHRLNSLSGWCRSQPQAISIATPALVVQVQVWRGWAVARLADALFLRFVPTLIGRRGQSSQTANLTPVAELSPAEELHDEQPGTIVSETPQQQQFPHLLHTRVVRRADRFRPLCLYFLDLLVHKLPASILPFQPCTCRTGQVPRAQPRQQGRPVPRANLFQPFQEICADRQAHPLSCQQSLDAVDVPRPVSLHCAQLAVQVPLVFRFYARHVHHAPHLLLAIVIANQHHHQLPHVQAVRLGPLRSPTDLDAGRVDHQILDLLRHQIAVQPEALCPWALYLGRTCPEPTGTGYRTKCQRTRGHPALPHSSSSPALSRAAQSASSPGVSPFEEPPEPALSLSKGHQRRSFAPEAFAPIRW